ncbi:hypothetical protein [Streptomyces sp. NPDC007856]|uniref:hypothetical protein n=1 Tax=Streptomyces sp. NPDC007856 TaxID=3364781 RepID=UPI0036974FBB
MPMHHTLSLHPRTTAPTTDESGRTGAGADGGTATGPHTARGAGAVRPDTLPPPPAARATLRDDQADATPGVTDGAVSVSPARHDDGIVANRPLPRSTTAPPAVADAGLIEGVTSGAAAVSPARHGDDGTAANRPLPRSATAPPAVADAGLNPGATLRDDRAGGRRSIGLERVARGNPAVAAPLLLKVA